MTTRSISTMHEHVVCDVCGRTLLRGENIEGFLAGGRRYAVCELCKQHAIHEGWVREGTTPDFQDTGSSQSRRRSLFGRRRGRDGDDAGAGKKSRGDGWFDDEPAPQQWDDATAAPAEFETEFEPAPAPEPAPRRPARRATRRSAGPTRQPPPLVFDETKSGYEQPREPKQVHAIPSGDMHKAAAAVNAFNTGEYCRTVSGVARSLGLPTVNVSPDVVHAGSVWIVVSWELCWYRYEVDISGPNANVRLDAQGYELDELPEAQRAGNAIASEVGQISLA